MMRILLLVIPLLVFAATATAQLWVEDFSGEANGATSGSAAGTPGGTWTTTYSGSGTFSRQGGRFEASNTGSEAVFLSNTVDISSAGYAIIEADVYSAYADDNDYLRMSYIVDGVEKQFYELIGGTGGGTLLPATPASAIVAGSTLQIKISIQNDYFWFIFRFDGIYQIDNLTITAAPTIYSRKSGTWTDATTNGTWSLTGHTGTACACVPLNTQVAVIGNGNTVTLPTSQTVIGLWPTINLAPGAVDVQATGTLQFSSNSVTLGILKGLIRVRNGGSISSTSGSITGEQLMFNGNVGGISLQVDAGGMVNVEDVAIGPNSGTTSYINGSGSITVRDDFMINASNAVVYSNVNGSFTIADRLEFVAGVTNSQLINNQPMTVSTVYLDDRNNSITNSSTMNVAVLQSGTNDHDNTIINDNGATLNLGSVTGGGRLTIRNAGTINQTGNFTAVTASSSFVNQTNGTWNWSAVPNTVVTNLANALNVGAANNTFNYSGNGNQSIISKTYHHLQMSGSGTKTPAAIVNTNGDLLIQNSATLAAAAFTTDVDGDLTIRDNGVLSGTGAVVVGGNWSAVNAASYVEGTTRSTTFDGANQTITNASGMETFNALTLSGSGIKNLTHGLDINGTLSLTGNTQFKPDGDITLAGNWAFNGTAATNQFDEGSNTVTLDGAGAQTITTTQTGGETFYSLTIAGAGLTSNNSAMTIRNDLTIGGSATTQLSGTGDISLQGNWLINNNTSANPFVENSRSVTFRGSGQQSFLTALPTGETFYRLVINNSSPLSPQVTVNQKVSISNLLTMTDGNITSTLSDPMTILTTATVSGGSEDSYVDGPMQCNLLSTTARTFNMPIGQGGNYGGVSLRVRHTSATNSYSYTAEIVPASAAALDYALPSGVTKVSEIRYWEIRRGTTAAPLNPTSADLNTTSGNRPRVTFNYVDADYVTQPNRLTIVKTIGTAEAWNNLTATATGGSSGTIISQDNNTNFTSFSLFALANTTGGTNPLPVELVSFNAIPENDNVVTSWRTASERDNQMFEVERAIDIEHFETIGTVEGSGTTNTQRDYHYTDTAPVFGRAYYRLKQVDYDGKHAFSKVVTVDYDGPRFASLRISPNPSDGNMVKILVSGLREQREVTVRITSAAGQIVFQQAFNLTTPGVLDEEIRFSSRLPGGVYIISAGTTYYLTGKLAVE